MESNYLQSKSIAEITKEIKDFESLNLNDLSIEQIKSKIHNIILGHLRKTLIKKYLIVKKIFGIRIGMKFPEINIS